MTASKESQHPDDDVYEMEDIVGYRIWEGQPQWRVKWKGYDDPNDETWEPKDNFITPGDVLLKKMEEYKAAFEKKNASTRKRGSSQGETKKRAAPDRDASAPKEASRMSENRRKARKTTDEEAAPMDAPEPFPTPTPQPLPLAPEPRKKSPVQAPSAPEPVAENPKVEKAKAAGGTPKVSHLGKPHPGHKGFTVTVRWSNGFEENLEVSAVREKYASALLDYLLSRVRFRDEQHH